MGNTLTIRLPEDLAEWLEETSRKSGHSRGAIVRQELERARRNTQKPWMRLAGDLKDGPRDLSMRKGFSPK
jgi:predicted transcriptional regulator